MENLTTESEPVNILVVDDKPENLLTIAAVLESPGQNLVKASSGSDALRHLLENDFAVILLDAEMPGMDGFETAGMIRQRERSGTTPIIFITATFSDPGHTSQAYATGAVDYVFKPVRPEILRAKVAVFVDLHKKTRQLRHLAESQACLLQELQEAAQAIAERQKAEDELKRFFSISLDLLCVAGTDGYFKAVNRSWSKVLGFSEHELLEKPYLEFVHPEDLEAMQQEAAKLAQGQVTIALENRYRCQDGSYRWLQWSATPAPERGLIYAAARDITERKQADQCIQELNQELGHKVEELAAVNRALEAFTYSVSHDLRAPLRHISGFSKILLENHGPEMKEEARRLLERVGESAQHMGTLIDELLNFSRLGRRELQGQITGLNSLLDEVLADLKTEAEGRQVEWQIGRLPFVECDPALMKQVLANLISNALKYTRPREKAVISVTSTAKDGAPVITVRDNGVGFSMKYADKLFGVFQRLHRPEDFEGTGVGLATVQRIIHKHGGRVWAEAELDQGAAFFFTLGSPNQKQVEAKS